MSEMVLIDFYPPQAINKLRGNVTFRCTARHMPRGMRVDEVYHWRGAERAMRMEVVEDEVMGGGKE